MALEQKNERSSLPQMETLDRLKRLRRLPRPPHPPEQPVTQRLRVQLKTVTPVLGGGTVTRDVDRTEVIRVPSLRGALRFWWRAVHGDKFADHKALAQKEQQLFGGVSGESEEVCMRSAVDVRVVDVRRTEIDNADIRLGDPDAYALWPARAQVRDNVPVAPRWRPGITFTLELSAMMKEEDFQQIEKALRALILFGGYGGRTRRGVGSLVVTADLGRWLPKRVEELRPLFQRGKQDARSFPLLAGASLAYGRQAEKTAPPAWHKALTWLRDFRQGAAKQSRDNTSFAREAPGGPPLSRAGRSNWPEADKIRHLMGHRGTRYPHPPRYGIEAAWPRAGFGLPILGQFQGKSREGSPYPDREPPPFELNWVNDKGDVQERLASPLIVKALPLADGTFVPIALWLHRAWPQGQVVLLRKGQGGKIAVPRSAAPFDRLLGQGDTALFNALAGKPNLQTAFFDWLQRSGNVQRL